MPKVIEAWLRVHCTPVGDVSVRVIESSISGHWIVTVSGSPGSSADSQHFDSLETAQRYGDDLTSGVVSPHDCRLTKCGVWEIDRHIAADESTQSH